METTRTPNTGLTHDSFSSSACVLHPFKHEATGAVVCMCDSIMTEEEEEEEEEYKPGFAQSHFWPICGSCFLELFGCQLVHDGF